MFYPPSAVAKAGARVIVQRSMRANGLKPPRDNRVLYAWAREHPAACVANIACLKGWLGRTLLVRFLKTKPAREILG